MKTGLFCLLLFCAAALAAQSKPCSEYAKILQKLDATFQNGAGDLDDCLQLVDALRACDPAQEETAAQWTRRIFDAIKTQKLAAEQAKARAEAEGKRTRLANHATRIALDSAEAARTRAQTALSIAKAAEEKAQTALKSANAARHRADSLVQEVLKAQVAAKNITLKSVEALRLWEAKAKNPEFFQDEGRLGDLKQELFNYADSIAELLPFKDVYWGKWGYKDAFGDIVIYPDYDAAFKFKNGVALVQNQGSLSEIDKTGAIVATSDQISLWQWISSHSGMKIPPDALPGGYTQTQETTYICRGRYEDDPGQGVHPGEFKNDSCRFGWGGKEIVVASFEILVLNKGLESKWVAPEEFGALQQAWIELPGGYNDQQGNPHFIARTQHNGELIPGKYWAGNCNFPYAGKEMVEHYDFQLLIVRPKE